MVAKKLTPPPVVPVFQRVLNGDWMREPDPDLINRAVREIDPIGSKKKCADKVSALIQLEGIETYNDGSEVRTWHALPDKNERRKLASLVSALEKSARALESLPTEWQQVLFLRGQNELSQIVDGHFVWPDAAERLAAFRQILEVLARRCALYGLLKRSQLIAGPAEQVARGDARKRHAANCAFDLLYEFRGAVARDGRFRSLASIIYEGFSGAIEEDLDQQCRAILAHHRRR